MRKKNTPSTCPTDSSSHFCTKNSACHRQKTWTHSSGCVDINHCNGHPSRQRLRWTFPHKTDSVPTSESVRQHPVYWWRLCNYVIECEKCNLIQKASKRQFLLTGGLLNTVWECPCIVIKDPLQVIEYLQKLGKDKAECTLKKRSHASVEGAPLRSIISSINSVVYNIAKHRSTVPSAHLCTQQWPTSTWKLITFTGTVLSNWLRHVDDTWFKGSYSISQKWVHPSHFCKYFIVSFHWTTLKTWHFDKI